MFGQGGLVKQTTNPLSCLVKKKKEKSFLNEDYAKTIVRILTKFSHNVPLMWKNILSCFRNDHVTQSPLVAVFQKVSKNNMCSHEWTRGPHIIRHYDNRQPCCTSHRIFGFFCFWDRFTNQPMILQVSYSSRLKLV